MLGQLFLYILLDSVLLDKSLFNIYIRDYVRVKVVLIQNYRQKDVYLLNL